MAVTGAIFNSLIYGGVNSADYGVYISGDAVFNAPQRAVELVSVPGRNGAISIDQGHFENIEVEYPAGMFGDDGTDFRQKLSDFRNAIMSQKGYQRLSDTYHPEEYRMGLYVEGLEVEPAHYNEAGQFVLKFNCKPQRYLVSGEEEVEVSSGDTIINPTLFDAQPLLEVKGYGNLSINGQEISLVNGTLGSVQILPYTALQRNWAGGTVTVYPTFELLNNGDQITAGDYEVTFRIEIAEGINWDGLFPPYWRDDGGDGTLSLTVSKVSNTVAECVVKASGYTLTKSSNPNVLLMHDATLIMRNSDDSTLYNFIASARIYYRNASYMIVEFQINGGSKMTAFNAYIDGMTGLSTLSILGNPTYIDCEIGEAYKYVDGEVVPLNAYIDLGSDLPVLSSGTNEITHDNTITDVVVLPRWWKV